MLSLCLLLLLLLQSMLSLQSCLLLLEMLR
jgi:hypothetical protein